MGRKPTNNVTMPAAVMIAVPILRPRVQSLRLVCSHLHFDPRFQREIILGGRADRVAGHGGRFLPELEFNDEYRA